MTTPLHKSILVGAAGLSLAGSVAACAPSTAQSSTPQNTSTQAGSSKLATTGSSSGSYKDGTYSADGSYTSPNGQETIGVQLTLTGGTISGVDITVHPSNPNTKKFQGEFKDGIAAQIVGKKLDDINVSKVAGSSLTSGGFNQAVETIKSEAK
ncbi:FMN-binding protein [Arthrobacter sp. MMS24-S77]